MIVLKEWKRKNKKVLENEEGKVCLESKWKKDARVEYGGDERKSAI